MRNILMIAALVGGTIGTALPLTPAEAQSRLGRPTVSARPNINRPNINRPNINRAQGGGMAMSAARNNRNNGFGNNINRPNYNRPGRRGNNVVVVNGAPGRGYYDNGRYYDRRDDGDNFLEFVGKTAAITAGVSAVSAVIGSVVKDKPSNDCQQQVQNGQVYLLCEGVWYTPAQASGQAGYQVVAPPVGAPQ